LEVENEAGGTRLGTDNQLLGTFWGVSVAEGRSTKKKKPREEERGWEGKVAGPKL